MYIKKLSSILASVELSIALYALIVFEFFSSYITGWKRGYDLWHRFKLKEYFMSIPYEKIILMSKGHYESERNDISCTEEEIKFFVFMMNPKIRHGLRALIAAMVLSIGIAIGFGWPILYLLAVALFVFGIIKMTARKQGTPLSRS